MDGNEMLYMDTKTKYPVWYSQMTHQYCCWVLQKCTKYFRFWIVKISDQILAFPVCPQTSVLWEMLFDNNRESQEVRTCWVHRFQRISNQFFSSRSQFKFPKDFVLISLLKWNISDLKLDCLFLNFYHFFHFTFNLIQPLMKSLMELAPMCPDANYE